MDGLRSIEVPLPPLDVQQRIVERLDAVATKLRHAKLLREEVHDDLRVLSERTIADIVARFASKVTRPLGDLVEIVGGGTPTRSIPAFWNGALPWITPKDMKAAEIHDAQQRITEDGLRASPTKLLPTNAVLVVVRGMILARFVPVALLCVPATINQDMKALIPKPPLSAKFLWAWLIANERALFGRVGKSTHNTRKLESDNLLSLPVPIVSEDEQHGFVEALRSFRAQFARLEKAIATATAEAEQVLPALLAESFGIG